MISRQVGYCASQVANIVAKQTDARVTLFAQKGTNDTSLVAMINGQPLRFLRPTAYGTSAHLIIKHLAVAFWRYAKLLKQMLPALVILHLDSVILFPLNLELPVMVAPADEVRFFAILTRLLRLAKVVVPALWPTPEVAL